MTLTAPAQRPRHTRPAQARAADAAPSRAARLTRPAHLLPITVALFLAACDQGLPAPGAPIRVRAVLGEIGASPGQFSIPRAIDAQPASPNNPRPCLWVVDKLGRIQRIDPDTGACTGWWRMPLIVLGKPTGITVGPAPESNTPSEGPTPDALWLADTHYHQILIYDPATVSPDPLDPREPRLLARFGSYGEEPGQFVYPTDVALLTDSQGHIERIYVAEYGGNDRITCLDPSFNVLFTFGSFGDSDDPDNIQFNRPQAIAIDAARRELIVADACNHRLGRFTLDGRLIAWIGSPDTPGAEPGQFRYPWGLALPGDGTALVVEQQGARVQHIDLASGSSIASYGRVGRGEGELATPWALTLLEGRLYIADTGNNRIIALDAPRRRTPPIAAAPAPRQTPHARPGGAP